MKVTITAETGEQDIEITRHRTWLGGNRLQETGKLLNGAAEDVRRALDLAPDSGTLLAAWRQVVGLVGADLDGSLQSVVDRVAEAVDARGREASREPKGSTS